MIVVMVQIVMNQGLQQKRQRKAQRAPREREFGIKLSYMFFMKYLLRTKRKRAGTPQGSDVETPPSPKLR